MRRFKLNAARIRESAAGALKPADVPSKNFAAAKFCQNCCLPPSSSPRQATAGNSGLTRDLSEAGGLRELEGRKMFQKDLSAGNPGRDEQRVPRVDAVTWTQHAGKLRFS